MVRVRAAATAPGRDDGSGRRKKLRIGLLGVKHSHADSYVRSMAADPRLARTIELVGVYDRDEGYGRRFARRYRAPFKTSVDALLVETDAVIIASENAYHHTLAKSAARAGKHILCEKPMALTLRQAEGMKQEVERSRVKFQMCYVMRYHTAATMVKGLIDAGRIGDIVAMVGVNKLNFTAATKSWFTDKKLSGGGAVMDHTVHLADAMRWYTGSEAKEVYCEIGRRHVLPRLRVEDTFLTTLTFEDGALGHIDGSWSYPKGYPTWGGVSVEILGSKGAVFLDAFRQNVYFTGMHPPDDRLNWQGYGCNANAEMIKGFAESITLDTEPVASIEDGIRGLEVTLASYESNKLGRAVRPAHSS